MNIPLFTRTGFLKEEPLQKRVFVENTVLAVLILLYTAYKFAIIKKDTFYNPDEFEWLYCVQKSNQNWRLGTGFNSHTSGPVAIWILQLCFKLAGDITIENLHRIKIIFETLALFSFFGIYRGSFQKKMLSIAVFALLISLNQSDFKAYNTEFLLLPVLSLLILLRNSKTVAGICIESLLIFILPLIKLQFAPISAVMFFFQIGKTMQLPFHKKLAPLITYIFLLILPFALFTSHELKTFLFNYLTVNIWYTKYYSGYTMLSALREFKFLMINKLTPIFVLLSISFYEFAKNGKEYISGKEKPVLFSLILLIFAFICVITPRNNFLHYYVILFLPLCYFITEALHKYSRAFSKFALIPFLFLLSVINISNEAKTDIWKIAPQFNDGSLAKNEWLKNHNIKNKNILDSVILNHYFIKNEKPTILVTGFFDAQPIYYRYSKLTNPVFRSNTTMYFSKLKGDALENDYNQFEEDLKTYKSPDIIIITKDFKINIDRFTTLISRDYSMPIREKGYEILIKKSL